MDYTNLTDEELIHAAQQTEDALCHTLAFRFALVLDALLNIDREAFTDDNKQTEFDI